jgi:hypothetical protein
MVRMMSYFQPIYNGRRDMNRDTATYIADMILELRNLAKGGKMSTLQGLLEISYYEAYSVANAIVIPEGEAQRLEEMGEHARRFEAA